MLSPNQGSMRTPMAAIVCHDSPCGIKYDHLQPYLIANVHKVFDQGKRTVKQRHEKCVSIHSLFSLIFCSYHILCYQSTSLVAKTSNFSFRSTTKQFFFSEILVTERLKIQPVCRKEDNLYKLSIFYKHLIL